MNANIHHRINARAHAIAIWRSVEVARDYHTGPYAGGFQRAFWNGFDPEAGESARVRDCSRAIVRVGKSCFILR